MYYRWSGSTLDILSSPLSLQIHRGWARILKIPLEACWSSELQRSRSPISQKIWLQSLDLQFCIDRQLATSPSDILFFAPLSLFDCTVVSFAFLFGLGLPRLALIAAHLHLDWYGVVWERWICQVSKRPIEALKRMSRLTEDVLLPKSHLFRSYFETSCVISKVSAKWLINKRNRPLSCWPREYPPPRPLWSCNQRKSRRKKMKDVAFTPQEKYIWK